LLNLLLSNNDKETAVQIRRSRLSDLGSGLIRIKRSLYTAIISDPISVFTLWVAEVQALFYEFVQALLWKLCYNSYITIKNVHFTKYKVQSTKCKVQSAKYRKHKTIYKKIL
jgi:hypothetical protein